MAAKKVKKVTQRRWATGIKPQIQNNGVCLNCGSLHPGENCYKCNGRIQGDEGPCPCQCHDVHKKPTKDQLLKSIKAFAFAMWEAPGIDVVLAPLIEADKKDGCLREDYVRHMKETLEFIVKMINGECVCSSGGPFMKGHTNCPQHNKLSEIETRD